MPFKSHEITEMVHRMPQTYASEPNPTGVRKKKFSVFLAGPTPRSADVKSWRPAMLEALYRAGYSGNVFLPENRHLGSHYDFDQQIPWEVNGLYGCDLIVFWIPRNLKDMPGFTTNIEYGEWMHSGKIVVGFPEDAVNTRYIKKRCEMNGTPLFHSLEEMADYVCRYEKKYSKWYNRFLSSVYWRKSNHPLSLPPFLKK
jgi:hypothetical protein